MPPPRPAEAAHHLTTTSATRPIAGPLNQPLPPVRTLRPAKRGTVHTI